MKGLISIKNAIQLLTMFRKQRLTREERARVDSTISQLSRAQVDPEYRAYLHTPVESRGE
jgi:hypothetical protein